MELQGLEYMGENIRDNLKYCGKDVRLYPLCKLIRAQNAKLDDNCQIFDYVFIDAGEQLEIGKYSTLTWYVLIEGGGKAIIGDRVFLGPGTKVLTSTYAIDGYYAIEHLPGDCGKILYGDIIIKDDAYIGANVTIMPGSTIAEGTVVGANSLVKGKLEPWTVYAGTPCKAIKKRVPPIDARREQVQCINWEKKF